MSMMYSDTCFVVVVTCISLGESVHIDIAVGNKAAVSVPKLTLAAICRYIHTSSAQCQVNKSVSYRSGLVLNSKGFDPLVAVRTIC
jgi:hypothetical protein